MVTVSGDQDLAYLAGIRVRLGDPFSQHRFNDGSAKGAGERVRAYGFTSILVRIHAVQEEHLGLIALFLQPVASGNGNTLPPFPVDVGVQIRTKVIRYINVALDQPLRFRDVHGRESLRVTVDRKVQNLKDGEFGNLVHAKPCRNGKFCRQPVARRRKIVRTAFGREWAEVFGNAWETCVPRIASDQGADFFA
jgi:hypothetical protein